MEKSTKEPDEKIWFVDDVGVESLQTPSAAEINQFAAYFQKIRRLRVRKQLILLIEEILADQERRPDSDAPPVNAKSG